MVILKIVWMLYLLQLCCSDQHLSLSLEYETMKDVIYNYIIIVYTLLCEHVSSNVSFLLIEKNMWYIKPLKRIWLKNVHLFNASNVREVCNEFQPNPG